MAPHRLLALAPLALVAWIAPPARAEPAGEVTHVATPIEDDVFGDRAFLTPTAFSQPVGGISIATHLLPVPMLVTSVGLSDRVHFNVGAAADVVGGSGAGFLLGGKATLVRAARAAVAVYGNGCSFAGATGGVGGATASLCFDPRCRGLASVNLAVVGTDHLSVLLGGASLILRMADHFATVFEADVVRQLQADHGRFNGLLLFGGARIVSHRLAVDLGIARLQSTDDGDGGVLPMLAVAYRFAK
jgi:hypothetical protein